ncbi:MAG: NAD(P)-binding domain-containing protein [PVC group bacterium]|nr:NAD(P)-binding domain-containing protein [PVC group bacterium]
MNDDSLIQIQFSRVIHAKKWKVIRTLTRVWELPRLVHSIKEVTVLQRSKRTLKTKWHIEVNNVPISWIEEETLCLQENRICFRAVEGDLTNFSGEWNFQDHPEGTQVSLSAKVRFDIPAIGQVSGPFIQQLLTRNFEAIMDAFERRLVSLRYSGYKKGDTSQLAGFGVIGHLYNFNHLEKCLKMLQPDFVMPSKEFLSQLFYITPSFKLYDILNFKSKTGQSVNGCFIVATFIPEMIDKDIWAVYSKVIKACKVAEKHGTGIVALGGFTSIVGERVSQQMNDDVDVPVTTGNAFTAAMTIAGIEKAVCRMEKNLNQMTLTIVGGTGDIGSACARVFASRVKKLILTGRTKGHLRNLRNELTKNGSARVIETTDNQSAVKEADVVIAAASASASILDINWFKPGAIICDVGYPKNVSYRFNSREDIFVFSGGLTKSPTQLQLPIDVGLPSPETIYGCFAEAIILALEKRYEQFSFGRGNITAEKIEEIRLLGAKHGFETADFFWGHQAIDESMIERIKKAAYV